MADIQNENRKPGWRCKECTFCGRCFDDGNEGGGAGWSGTRCDVCVGCGKCAKEWGLLGGDDADAASGPTNWADAFKVMDIGTAGEPPAISAAPGKTSEEEGSTTKGSEHASVDVATGATSEAKGSHISEECNDVDTATGATPGVASACKELGLDDMESVMQKLDIKPPGVS